MWKKIGIAIQRTDDCKVRIIKGTFDKDAYYHSYCLWLGDGDFPILGDLADFRDIAQGILNELQKFKEEDFEMERRRAEGE